MKSQLKYLFILFPLILSAQEDRYLSGMKKGLSIIDSAKSSDDFIMAGNFFERIALAEKSMWLPFYYASLSYNMAGIMGKEKDLKDSYFDKALSWLDSCQKNKPDSSEVLCLKGYITLMKISVSPMSRGPKFGPEGAKLLEEAKRINPSNPRPYYVHGQNTFYTPAMFGGGKNKALPLLEEAVEKYKTFVPESDLHPNWGKQRAEYLAGECKKN
ncbi:MAG: hypothetical protein A3G23_04285 [Bacteroidetes bacterium RIFCSPLOWO2_12_FULL_37_12]|nr:MAG: hypothetical protein A3G23_04285 [Bacteroidetes bacterium RIFCSPLOWO2_12_FULL_37_12]